MPLGELFSCVWLVLLAFYLMTTYPHYSQCNTNFKDNKLPPSSSSIPDQHSTTAAISEHLPCHHRSIDTSELISPDCQLLEQKQKDPRMRITGDISEGPGPPSCPKACADNKGQNESDRSDKYSPCHRYLVEKDCVNSWLKNWSSIRLRHCCEHTVQEAVPNAENSLNDPQQCEIYVRNLLELDAFVAKVTCQFEQVLLRYDCQQNYSVNSCQQCKVAYRRWVCASLIPHWRERHKIKPCRSICHTVEQSCPWFLPADKNPGYPAQYAGEPIFQCIDSNIPETGEQLMKSTYGSSCCYDYCESLRPINSKLNSGYHMNNHRSYVEIVSCTKGCDNSSNNLQHNTKTSSATLCNDANTSKSSSTSSSPNLANSKVETNNNSLSIPFVNFPLSSCPSASSSTSVSSNSDFNSKLNKQHSSACVNASNLLIWFLFYLFYTNNKLYSWR